MKKNIAILLLFTAIFTVQAQNNNYTKKQGYDFNEAGLQYHKQRDFKNAEISFLNALDIFEKTLGKEHPDYIIVEKNLGYLYNSSGIQSLNEGDYKNAEISFLNAIDIFGERLGKEHPDYITAIDNLGYLYNNFIGNYSAAELCYLEKKNLQEKMLGKSHPDYAKTLCELGELYQSTADYAQSEKYLLEAKGVYEKSIGKENASYARALNDLGLICYDKGDYVKAEAYHLEAKAIRQKVLGKENVHYALSLNNLGEVYRAIGNYAKAEAHHLEAKAIREKTLGKMSALYALSLNNLGALYSEMGDYAKSESHYLEAKGIYEKLFGKQSRQYARTLNNLGKLYYSLGDYAETLSCFYEAMFIFGDILGKEHPDYATAVSNVAFINDFLKAYSEAEKYSLEAKNIYEKLYGKEHRDYARSKIFGKQHADYALALNNLGVLYLDIGENKKAEEYHLAAKKVYEKIFSKEHQDYLRTVDNLGFLYLALKNYTKSAVYYEESCKTTINMINRDFAFMSEQQRGSYWHTKSSVFETSYSLSWLNPVPETNKLNYNNALFSKGLLLRTTNAVRDAVYSSGDATLIERFETLRTLREQIAALHQKEDADQAAIQKLEAEANSIDKALTKQSSAFADLKADTEMQWQDVQKNLKADEAAIEFVSFKFYDKKTPDKTMYAALILRPKVKAPEWVPLCEETQLQDILSKATGRNADQQARIIYDIFGAQLYSVIWKPLEESLKGVKTIYYAPSGLLHKVAFNALPTENEERLADKYSLNLVSSTREVVYVAKSKTNNFQLNNVVLYGGLKYDIAVPEMKTAALQYAKTDAAASAGIPDGITRGAAWVELPATREETLMIRHLIEANTKKISYTLFQDNIGNEESFKALNGKKTNLIHLATHGFFLADSEQQENKNIDNPLLRSGLLLSGGNNAWTNKKIEGVEDGILTADEISRLNLLGAQLVVLSACQTGLGDVKNSEGVFGLQRAFKLAGVETLIMSLWEVDDAATAKLMSIFYTEWLAGKNKQAAFKEAQRQVRADYPAPYYWAAFVMMD